MKIYPQFRYTQYKNTFSSLPEIISHMEHLDTELSKTDMQNLKIFNTAYLTITKNVFLKLGKEYFVHDERMKALDIIFAQYYFDALKSYVETTKTVPAWQILFDSCKTNTSYQCVYLAMGVNAHVNNDLPQALHDAEQGESFKTDFDNVNQIIYDSLFEIILSLQERSIFFYSTKTLLKPFYRTLMKSIIRKWRANAWDNYVSFKKKDIEKTAFSIAQTLEHRQLFGILHILRNI